MAKPFNSTVGVMLPVKTKWWISDPLFYSVKNCYLKLTFLISFDKAGKHFDRQYYTGPPWRTLLYFTAYIACYNVGTWVAVAVGFRGAGRRSGEIALCQGHGSCGVLGLFDAAAFGLPYLVPQAQLHREDLHTQSSRRARLIVFYVTVDYFLSEIF